MKGGMIMKKIFINIAALVAVATTLFSCSLSEISYNEIDQNKYMNNAKEAESVLQGIYSNLAKEEMYGYYFSIYFTLPSDEAKVEGSSLANFRNVPNNSYTSTESSIEKGWQAMYRAIYSANDFIERLSIKKADFSETEVKAAEVYIAEARALRALFYFELVRWYGNVPLMTSTSQSGQHPSTFVQADPKDVYAFIEKDLTEAIKVLPYADSDDVRASSDYRFSKGAAMGLLAKVYATWAGYPLNDTSKWKKAEEVAGNLIAGGHHALLPKFRTLWENTANGIWDPAESLIEVSFYSPTITGIAANDASGRIGKWNGVTAAVGEIRNLKAAGNWKVIPMFGQTWKGNDKDLRFEMSIADYQYKAEKGKVPISDAVSYREVMTDAYTASSNQRKAFCSALTPAKWDTEVYTKPGSELSNTDYSNVNWYILRYADVLLLYAEAANEVGGPTSDAIAAVNMVRRRGFGLPVDEASAAADLPEGLTKESFREVIHNERAWELAFEGHRRQDLTRWGIYCRTVLDTYRKYADWFEDGPTYFKAGEYTIVGKNELLPIPQHELDLCPKFKQNPKWE